MMATSTSQLDALMEAASQALGRMHYLRCEALCLEALSVARLCGEWSYYARILLPLQEARRQRRLIAADGVIRLGTAQLGGDPVLWLRRVNPGCLVLTQPHDNKMARQILAAVSRRHLYVEILLAHNAPSDKKWTLCPINGPKVTCVVDAPPQDWIDQWLGPRADRRAGGQEQVVQEGQPGSTGPGPADWFLDACEGLGNAALDQVKVPLGDPRRVWILERCLQVVTDHEILHQALGEAARAAGGGGGGRQRLG